MNVKDHASIFRIASLAGIAASTMILSIVFAIVKKLYIDESICILLFSLVFTALFILVLELQRKQAQIGGNTETSFVRIAFCYAICCVMMFAMCYLPAFYKPVMLITLLMYAVSNELIALTVVVYYISLYGLLFSAEATEIILFSLMCLFAAAFASSLKKEGFRFISGMLVVILHILIPGLFYYWTYHEIQPVFYAIGAAEGLFIAVFIVFVLAHIREETEKQITLNYMDMIQDTYPLVTEVKAYSAVEYEHARKVAELCYRAAQKLEFDENLCAAAGFYYRLGRWEGEPYVENGVRQAQKYCFPKRLIDILNEYYGERKKPSTPESALVHIVDAITIKIEVLNKDLTLSDWNRDILIYQSLDGFSASGLYDESGMSINQFLRLREYLVKEAVKE